MATGSNNFHLIYFKDKNIVFFFLMFTNQNINRQDKFYEIVTSTLLELSNHK